MCGDCSKVNARSRKPNRQAGIDEEFSQLREITDNYTVPNDACETYEAVYNMLAELMKIPGVIAFHFPLQNAER